MEIWVDRSYVPAGYGWSFPADDELRIGVGSFDPRFHVKDNTVKLAGDLDEEPVRYQGNWIPHKLRHATEDSVFFVGDSAGHCLPLTAEGIRTALYFGLACGRELRSVGEGRRPREDALRRYHDFSAGHEWMFRWTPRARTWFRVFRRGCSRAGCAEWSGSGSWIGRSATTSRSPIRGWSPRACRRLAAGRAERAAA